MLHSTRPLLKILFLAANPTSTERLSLDREAREISRAIDASPNSDRIVIEPCWSATAEDVQRALLERAPQILHLSAHGDQRQLFLADALGGGSAAAFEGLVSLLALVNRDRPRVRVVVINACDSAGQLDALCAHVDCAVGMSAPMLDEAAIVFSAAFYHALGIGLSVADSFAAARARLQLEHPEQAGVPRLAARPGLEVGALVLLPAAGAPPPAPRDVEASGRLLPGHELKSGVSLWEGRFVLEEWIGQGAVATVWRARDRRLDREVALKILHERCASDSSLTERFFRGARLMSQFQHPTVVRVLEPYCEWHRVRFFVMEYVPGHTLMDYALARGLSWREVLAYGVAVGEALAYAHERSCFHRDVKPSNILIDERGRARLFDFDLVRDRYFEGGTRQGGMGTFAYAAPEVLEQPNGADGRCDVYSLAMTLTCVLAGRELHRDEKREPKQLIRTLPCPPEVQQVLTKALEWDRDRRHGSMLAFLAALRDALDRHERGRALRRNLAQAGAVLASAAVLGAGFAWWKGQAPASSGEREVAAAPAVATPYKGAMDADNPLREALQVDHGATAVAIRITADNTLDEAREHARAVLAESRFRPWIVRQSASKTLYFVFVGDYADRRAAEADRLDVREIRGEGAIVTSMRELCPALRHNPAGYHDCQP